MLGSSPRQAAVALVQEQYPSFIPCQWQYGFPFLPWQRLVPHDVMLCPAKPRTLHGLFALVGFCLQHNQPWHHCPAGRHCLVGLCIILITVLGQFQISFILTADHGQFVLYFISLQRIILIFLCFQIMIFETGVLWLLLQELYDAPWWGVLLQQLWFQFLVRGW